MRPLTLTLLPLRLDCIPLYRIKTTDVLASITRTHLGNPQRLCMYQYMNTLINFFNSFDYHMEVIIAIRTRATYAM